MFNNGLQIEELPLMTYEEMNRAEAASATTEKTEEQQTQEEEKEPKIKTANELFPDNSGLVPISEEDLIQKTGEQKTTTTPTIDYKATILKLKEKYEIDEEGFNIEDYENNEEGLASFLEELTISAADIKVQDYVLNNLTPIQQKFTSLIMDGVSEKDAAEIVKGFKVADGVTKEILVEDEAKAKAFYTEYLKRTTNHSAERILKEVTRKVDAGTIGEDAADVLPEFTELLEKQEQTALQSAKDKEAADNQKKLDNTKKLQEYISNTNTIGNITLSKELKAKWQKEYDVITDKAGNKINPIHQVKANNPTEYEALLRLYNAMGLFKFDAAKGQFTPDFTVIKSLGEKEAVEKLKKAANQEGVLKTTKRVDDTQDLDKLSTDDHVARMKKALGIE